GHPGDPVNIGLVGSEEDVVRGMTAAGWYPAAPITFASSVRIAADTVFRRPDDDAPVSNLFLFGRKEDLAFEQPLAGGPGKRHHVRFWLWDQSYQGRHGWFGAATYDQSVGFSHTTGQVTHHIAPNVDAERDRLVAELQKAGTAQSVEWKDGFHERCDGRNGGGDPWHTDGRLAIVTLRRSERCKGQCHAREGGHPVIICLCEGDRQGLLDRPVSWAMTRRGARSIRRPHFGITSAVR